MRDYEVIGYAESGEVYCTECAIGSTRVASPIFAGSEGEFICSECGDNLHE